LSHLEQGGIPAGSVSLFLEMNSRDQGLSQICWILDRRRENEICIAVGLFHEIVILSQFHIAAVWNAVPPQVARPKVRRQYFERTSRWSSAVTGNRKSEPRSCQLPFGFRDTLHVRAYSRRGGEMKKSRLFSGVAIDPKCLVILPCDMKPAGNAHDVRRTVCFALFSCRFIFRRIPSVGDLPRLRIKRYSAVISFIREHSPAPVFGNNGNPITRHIKSGCGPGCRRWSATSGATTLSLTVQK